jgi:hypothetical protein
MHIFINAHSYALLASPQTGLQSDIPLGPGLGSGTSGHVYLVDGLKNEIDRVGWGEAVNPEGSPAILGESKVIERHLDITTNKLIDTDNNENDFFDSTTRDKYQYGALFDKIDFCNNISGIQEAFPIGYTDNGAGGCNPPVIDICPNLDGMQIVPPSGYGLNEIGYCVIDVCLNIGGLQVALPAGMDFDEKGNCTQHDECANFPGLQAVIPPGLIKDGDNCKLDVLPLQITELLPNATGNDDGNEFIELYNPNDSDVYLTNYALIIEAAEKILSFPNGAMIKAGQYMAFSNDDIKFTLLNSTGSVQLVVIDGNVIGDSVAYENPKEGLSWALIDGVWQYTNRPTPGLVNLPSIIIGSNEIEADTQPITESDLKPCAANQYRSSETNRCRLIATSGSTLTPCKDGQYRSEETNRCRNIADDANYLTPCGEGEERNPDTNRCRSIGAAAVLGTSDLKPCTANQERNPETNRCRNIVSPMPQADYAPKQVSQSENNYILWWSLAGVGLVATIYGIWEWRTDLVKILKKIIRLLHRKR